jgi:ribosomal subunit interface protein
MRIIIKQTLLELPLELRNKIEKRMKSLEKFLKYWEKDEELEMLLEIGRNSMHHRKGDVYRVEINLPIHNPKNHLRSVSVSDNLTTATSEAYQEIKRQIRKFKIKREVGIRGGARKLKRLILGR